jgi:sugar lactone lactonase YvrE
VETVFNSPGSKPNGLQATREGLWIMDQGEGNRAHLVTYEGKVLRGFETEADRASGITFDGEAIWIASTYGREIIRADAHTGKTLQRFFTPGAGVIYRMTGDPPGRSSPLAKREPQQPRPKAKAQGQQVGGFQQGQVLGARAAGTGGHGLEWRDGRLWVAVPPSRMIYRIEPKEWIVEQQFPTAGNRPHGIGWEGKYLWCADSNLNAFFKHDTATGEILEKIQLAESDPLPHGMTIWQGWMWYCDDVGVVCRLKM